MVISPRLQVHQVAFSIPHSTLLLTDTSPFSRSPLTCLIRQTVSVPHTSLIVLRSQAVLARDHISSCFVVSVFKKENILLRSTQEETCAIKENEKIKKRAGKGEKLSDGTKNTMRIIKETKKSRIRGV